MTVQMKEKLGLETKREGAETQKEGEREKAKYRGGSKLGEGRERAETM